MRTGGVRKALKEQQGNRKRVGAKTKEKTDSITTGKIYMNWPRDSAKN